MAAGRAARGPAVVPEGVGDLADGCRTMSAVTRGKTNTLASKGYQTVPNCGLHWSGRLTRRRVVWPGFAWKRKRG
eukprot:3125550-Pyramimonas_sp.AAC.1